MRHPRRSRLLAVVLATAVPACLGLAALLDAWDAGQPSEASSPAEVAPRSGQSPPSRAGDDFAEQRQLMLQDHLRGRDVSDARVLAAMERVPAP